MNNHRHSREHIPDFASHGRSTFFNCCGTIELTLGKCVAIITDLSPTRQRLSTDLSTNFQQLHFRQIFSSTAGAPPHQRRILLEYGFASTAA